MDADSQRVLDYLTDVEEAAEDALTTKQQVNYTGSKHFKREHDHQGVQIYQLTKMYLAY